MESGLRTASMRTSMRLLSDRNPLSRAVADALLACAYVRTPPMAIAITMNLTNRALPKVASRGSTSLRPPMNLIDDSKEVYIRDSEQLWGARHWET